MWLLLLAGGALVLVATRRAAPGTAPPGTAPALPGRPLAGRMLVAATPLGKRPPGGPVALTPGQQITVKACNEISDAAARTKCLQIADPNVFCAYASSDPAQQKKCLDYAADPCGELVKDPTAQDICRRGVKAYLDGSVSVEGIVTLQTSIGAELACAKYIGPEAGPICAKIAEKIVGWVFDQFKRSPPTPNQLALMVLKLSRGTFQYLRETGGSPTTATAYTWTHIYDDPVSVANVQHNLKRLGLKGIWKMPGGIEQSRDVIRIVLTAQKHLGHPAKWWATKRQFP